MIYAILVLPLTVLWAYRYQMTDLHQYLPLPEGPSQPYLSNHRSLGLVDPVALPTGNVGLNTDDRLDLAHQPAEANWIFLDPLFTEVLPDFTKAQRDLLVGSGVSELPDDSELATQALRSVDLLVLVRPATTMGMLRYALRFLCGSTKYFYITQFEMCQMQRMAPRIEPSASGL
jgi:hypothetical protein